MLQEMHHKSSQLHKLTRPGAQSAPALQATRVALDFRSAMTDPLRLEALRRIATLVAQVLPNARLRTIEGAGHMLPLTHHEAVNAAIAEHLSRNTAARQRPAAA